MPSAAKKPLDRQVIVITGASSGIGLATARMAAAPSVARSSIPVTAPANTADRPR